MQPSTHAWFGALVVPLDPSLSASVVPPVVSLPVVLVSSPVVVTSVVSEGLVVALVLAVVVVAELDADVVSPVVLAPSSAAVPVLVSVASVASSDSLALHADAIAIESIIVVIKPRDECMPP
jgi:hypothetical protein